MKTNRVFVGTIKKCNNVYWYNIYGDTHYEGDYKLKSIDFGSIKEYARVIDDQAILIKTKDNRYLPLKWISTLGERVLIQLGLNNCSLPNKPSNDGDYFVDSTTLVPYFDKEEKQNISIHSLKRRALFDCRIKGGIEH